MDNTIDSLQIDIVESASTADKSIDALVSSLKKLDRIGKSNSFSIIQKQLKGIARVNFDKLDTQLSSITKNLRELKGYQKFLKNIDLGTPTIDTVTVSESVDEVVDELHRAREEIVNVGESFGTAANVRPAWLDDVESQCDSIIDSFDISTQNINAAKQKLLQMLNDKQSDFGDKSAFFGATDFTNTLDDKMVKLSLQATLLQAKMQHLKESGNVDSASWFTLQKALLGVKLQFSQLEQQTKKHARAVDALGQTVEKTRKPLGKLVAQFGRVAMYRAIRFVLSQIMQSVTEGLQNIAKFSNEANQIMSAYKTEFLYIKNSLASALLPVMEALLPTVIRLTDAFVDISNSVGIIGAGLAGDSTFLKAKRYAQDYKKSLDEVKKATVSFDEINVLSKVDTNNNPYEMFEEVEIDGWDVAASIAKISALTASITALVMMIKGVNIGNVFTKMGKGIKTAWTYLKNASGWKKAGISIAAIAGEAVICYNAFYDMFTGTKTVGQGLLELIPTIAATGAAMYAMWGVWGLVAAAVVAAGSALIAYGKSQEELRKKMVNDAYFSNTGVALEDLASAYESAWGATERMREETETMTLTLDTLGVEIEDSYADIQKYLGIISSSSGTTSDDLLVLKNVVAELQAEIDTVNGSITLTGSFNKDDWTKLLKKVQNIIDTLDTNPELAGKYDKDKWDSLLSTVQNIVNDLDTNPELIATYDKSTWKNITGEIEDLIGDIDADVSLNANTEKFIEAIEAIENEVSSMVSNLNSQLTTRTDGIWKTFNRLAETAKSDFKQQMEEMGGAFAEFAENFESATADLETKIEKILDKAATSGGLTEQDRTDLEVYINMLNDLNTNKSVEATAFEDYIQKNIPSGLEVGSLAEAQTLLNGLAEKAASYRSSIDSSYLQAKNEIENLMAQNDKLYSWGYMSKEDYQNFNRRFEMALSGLTDAYDESIANLVKDTEEAANLIQQGALKNTENVKNKAESTYDNASWWAKTFGKYRKGEDTLIYNYLKDSQEDLIDPLNDSINSILESVGSSQSAWLSSAMSDLMKNNFTFDTSGGNGGMYAIYDGTWEQDVNNAINQHSSISNSGTSSIVGSSGYHDPLSGQWSTGPHPDYPNPSQWMLDYGVQLTRNEATILRRELSRRNSSGYYDSKIADLATYIEWMKAKGYAKGGFPEDDSLIYVNPHELIGKMSNGKNVVANNYQIIEGIKQGVSEAMSESGGNGGDWTIQIVDTDGNVKGETIITAAERKNRRDGKTVISVGG